MDLSEGVVYKKNLVRDRFIDMQQDPHFFGPFSNISAILPRVHKVSNQLSVRKPEMLTVQT